LKIENGFVKIAGSSDLEDSSMAAGLCAFTNYFGNITVSLNNYFDSKGFYRRCENSQYLFSRDQTICFLAGLWAQKYPKWKIDLKFVNGKDIMPPSVQGHVRRCKGLKSTWFQDQWLWAELYFSAKFKPMDELNQLFAMMLIADPKFLKWYCKNNKVWRESLRSYWCNWRNEPEFCEHFIKHIESKL
jgi:hypothetical protein